MSPETLLMLLACSWALIKFWLLPLTKERWLAADTRGKMAKAGILVVLEKAADLTRIGAIALLLILAALWLLGIFSGSHFAASAALLATLSMLYKVAKSWSEGYGGLVGAIGLAAIIYTLYYSAKFAKQRVMDAWIAKAGEVRSLMGDDLSASLDLARQSPALLPLAERIESLISLVMQQESLLQKTAADPDNAGEHIAQMMPSEVMEKVHGELSDLISALAVELAKDQVDFDAAVATPSADEQTAASTPFKRLMRILSSERLGKDLGLVKKPLSAIVTGLLFVSLLGWAATPLAPGLQLAVNTLQVNAVASDVDTSLEAAFKEHAEPVAVPSPSDEPTAAPTPTAVSRMVAREVVREMLRPGMLERLAGVQHATDHQAEFARAALSGQAQQAAEWDDAATRIRKEAFDAGDLLATQDAAGTKKLQEHIEETVKPHVERLQKERPKLYATLFSRVEAHYATPISPLDAQGKLMGKILDTAVGGIDAAPNTELGKQGQKLAKEFGKEALKTWTEALAKSYVTNAIMDSAKGGVMAHASERFGFHGSDEVRKLVVGLNEAQGNGWLASQTASEESRMTKAVAEKVTEFHAPDSPERTAVPERLGGYDALFPGGGAGGGGGGAPGYSAPTANNAFSHQRARSFHLAARSFRVRGVLVGQDLPVKGLNVSEIRWKLEAGSTTKIVLEFLSDGKWIKLGRFDAAVVNQALRYAADQRVVATTITPGDGKVIGRATSLHPVLSDTPLGCRIVEADRFIDTFSFAEQGANPGSPIAQLQSDRIEFARWQKIAELAEKIASIPENEQCPVEKVESVIALNKDVFQRVKFSPVTGSSIERFLEKQETASKGSTTFLRAAHGCAVGNQSLGACLCKSVRSAGLSYHYWFPEDHTSQFRERQATIGPDLRWMTPSRDRLGHFDLWVHTTFAQRSSARAGNEGDETTATTVELPREQLDALRHHVSARLARYLSDRLHSPSYEDFMAPLEDFVIVQRFARAALAQRLGQGFPLNSLVRLEAETRRYVPRQPTIRWEPANGNLPGLLLTLNRADPKAEKAFVEWRQDASARRQAKRPLCGAVSL